MRNLSDAQLQKLADISSDLGLVAIAAVVLPSVLERFKLWPAVIGFLATLVFWVLSLNLLKGK